MSIPFLVSILLLVVAAVFMNRRRLALWLSVLALGLLISSGPVARIALRELQQYSRLSAPVWKDQNIIVVLGMGTLRSRGGEVITNALGFSRVYEAARLYQSCRDQAPARRRCQVLLSGGDPSGSGVSEAETMASELEEVGLPRADLLTETKSLNTFQNAQYSTERLKAVPHDQLLLVTSGLHLRRALLNFEHFGVGVLVPAPSDQVAVTSFVPLAMNLTFIDLALHEWAGLTRYRFYNWLGWNPITHRAGSL